MSTHHVDYAFTPPDFGKVRQIMGTGDVSKLRLTIVSSRFNEALVLPLLDSARAALAEAGVPETGLRLIWVPGAYEIPVVAEWAAASRNCDAVIALGCIIEGETPHAMLISESVARALTEISMRHGVPALDGVVSVRTQAQAEARCRPGPEGRGWHVARAAVEMGLLMKTLRDLQS
ncbi:MAG: 6,7-dimethyl-8-ribityllumazine synthase [Kiritimatiellae bacterium]|nr:6,7-dimethyl-8-ribityllumazine synthase [Kiritimatiellia bacterium]